MKRKSQYREANLLYLAEKAKEEGIVALPSGVLYRWIERGPAGKPFATPSSIVFVRYTGGLIDGSEFDSNLNAPLPACFVVRDLIMGWQIALSRMRQGDRMELYVPAQYGYGRQSLPGIPADSTLIFQLELVKLEPR